MRWYDRFDAWMVGRVFQPEVDFSQKRIGWWGAVVSLVIAVRLAATAELYTAWTLLIAGLYLAFSIASWCSDAFYAYFCSGWFIRVIMYTDLATALLILALSFLSGNMQWLWLIGRVLFIALYFFAQCKPPRPKQPSRKLVLGMG